MNSTIIAPGSATITLTVSDDALTASDDFTLTVNVGLLAYGVGLYGIGGYGDWEK